ncbi:restriction endonuclease subunit S [Ponticaulis profundi]|uniref:Restriction endonuclease subunit S n=1 Tax=Ponticaulis profundi TaxID=2665222 RepID=A0ABW1SDG7_9PROT
MTASQKYGVIYQVDYEALEGMKVMQVVNNHEILKHVEAGDFVISMRSFQGGLEYSDNTGSVSSAYVAIKPTEMAFPSFYKYLFKSKTYIQALQSTSNLVRDGQALRYSNFVQVDLPLPPQSEQKAIARFLDRETANIDELIASQEDLIRLLNEKRQAVISHAVTKGLDSNAPMKPSGIEWLGDIPAHWEVQRLGRRVQSISSGTSVNSSDEPASNDEIAVLKTSCVYSGTFDVTQNKKVVPEEYERVSCPVTAGALIVSRMNTPDLVGAAGLATLTVDNVFLPDRLWKVEFHGLVPEFAHLWTRSASYRTEVRLACAGTSSSMQNLSQDEFKAFTIAVPPETEQIAIARDVDAKLIQFDALENESTWSISLLKERRAALISAAVTGKIDVRSEVELPEDEAIPA